MIMMMMMSMQFLEVEILIQKLSKQINGLSFNDQIEKEPKEEDHVERERRDELKSILIQFSYVLLCLFSFFAFLMDLNKNGKQLERESIYESIEKNQRE